MRFEVKISYIPTEDSMAAGDGDPSKTFEMEGDLAAIKTYIKLVNSDNFNWGAIQRLDNLQPGDVDRWLIQKNRATGELLMSAFSFFAVDTEINVNAMRAAVGIDHKNTALNKALGVRYFS